MDQVSEQRLSFLHPEVARLARVLLERLEDENIYCVVVQGLRTWAEQDHLYAQGRTLPGNIVTNAPAGHSWHNYGLAFDCAPVDQFGRIDWNGNHPAWKRMEIVGVRVGLVAGANFRTFPDAPHFQWTGRLPVSPNDAVIELHRIGGQQGVWDATNG